MKKNDWILIASVFLYSFLFYEQFAGLNFFIFNCAAIAGLYLSGKTKTHRMWWFVAVGCLISAICITIYSSPLAIVSNIISLGLLSALSINPDTSVIVSLILSLASIASSIVFMFLDWMRRSKKAGASSRPLYVTIIMLVLIFFISLLFFVMYQSSNPLFLDLTKNINLDFISWPWVFFTLGGLILLYGFYYCRDIDLVSEPDKKAPSVISHDYAFESSFLNKLVKLDTEYLSGIILLSVLNLMLLTVNVLDLNYLWFDGKLPENVDHKQFVHNGVGILITSIILAIIIILYYFRGRLNYKEGVNHLKGLAILWIIQNGFMIFSTAYRTNMYVEEFGLSYKKIGVFVYLFLTLIGLITTFYKLRKNKSNWYLVRTNSWIWYGLLVFSCLLNWDVIITNFNINKAFNEKKTLEKYYLADLSFKNLPQLLQLPDTIKSKDDFAIRDYYYQLKGTYFHNFKIGLDRKLYHFLSDIEGADLRSWCYEKSRVFKEVLELSAGIKDLDLSNGSGIASISCLHVLNNLKVLNLNNSSFRKLEQLSAFKELESLSLRSNQIDSLEKLPALDLKYLYLGGNPVKDMDALNKLEKLETLLLDGSSLNETPALSLRKLHTLDISNNTITDFTALKNYPALKHLNLRNTFVGKIPTVPAMSGLESLDLSSNELCKLEPTSFIRNLSSSKNLKSLALENNGFARPYFLTNYYSRANQGDPVQAVFPLLERLDLSQNLLVSCAMIDRFTNLKELDLGGNKLKQVENLFSLVSLKKLDLNSNPIESLKGIEQLKLLEELNISNCHVPSGINEISRLSSLRKLDVSGNHCKDLELINILGQLESLDLSNTDLNTLKGIEKLEKLETLYLQNLNISDFTPLYTLKKLRLLHVNNISKEKLLKLKKSLPLCEIHEAFRHPD